MLKIKTIDDHRAIKQILPISQETFERVASDIAHEIKNDSENEFRSMIDYHIDQIPEIKSTSGLKRKIFDAVLNFAVEAGIHSVCYITDEDYDDFLS